MSRLLLAAVTAATLSLGLGHVQAQQFVHTVPLPRVDGPSRVATAVIVCTAEAYDSGKVKYDFDSQTLYVQDFDGCYYQLHVDHGHVSLPHD